MNVAIIGISSSEESYSLKALTLLREKGHTVYPVNPNIDTVCGIKAYPSVRNISDSIDTVTLYLNSTRSTHLMEEILRLKPKRIIFNPGAENFELEKRALAQNIAVLKACTLVLLTTDQF
jgi:uncharacterized protein